MPKLTYRTTLPKPDDPDILESIYEDVKRGVPLKYAAIRAGISEWTAYGWVDQAKAEIGDGAQPHGELGSVALFGQVVKEAHAACVDDRLAKSDAAEGNNWQKHVTVLERRFRDDFGRDQRITTESVSINVNVTAELTEAQTTELLAALAERSGQPRTLPSVDSPQLEHLLPEATEQT